MKSILLVLMSLFCIVLSADEREDLLKKFEAEQAAVESEYKDAFTTLDLTVGAGRRKSVAESLLYRALEYKLRQTADVKERLHLLALFAELNREFQSIYDEPREGTGSLENMLRYSRVDNLAVRQAYIWLADRDAEQRWKRICNAVGMLGKNEIRLVNGRASFETEMYNSNVKLVINIFIDKTFTYNGRDFVLFYSDLDGAVNDDFCTLYFCEFKDGRIIKSHVCRNAYFDKMIYNNGKLTLVKGKDRELLDFDKF